MLEQGVNIIKANRWGDLKYCNKLCQFDSPELLTADYLFICDCDIAFIENIEEIADLNSIVGKTVDAENPSIEILEKLFDKYDYVHPEIVQTYLGRSFITNCNGGLYGIPQKYFKLFGEKWKNFAAMLLHDEEALTLLGEKRIHIDQIAFSMALSNSKINFKSLPTIYNTPTHCNAFLPKIIESLNSHCPKVLHYHSAIDKIGLLELVGHDQIDSSIGIANRLISRKFDNKLFWDFRYAYFPELGSGVGSRGETLQAKRKMLKLAGIEKAASILDVGCGDGEVLAPFTLKNYCGVDHSPKALELSKAKQPQGTFLLFPDKDSAKISDLVICLDVLIHQDTSQDYFNLVDYISRKTRNRLIVSGYGSQEKSDNSCMCHFYEDLRTTLEKTGQFLRVYKFFEYRNLDVLIAEKKDHFNNCPPNKNDINESILQSELKVHSCPDLLFENIVSSRSVFGWFTKHFPRIYEYPWILSQFGRKLENMKIAEFGAGISALPLLLSMRGQKYIR